MFARLFLLGAALAVGACASAQDAPAETADTAPPASEWVAACEDWDEWDKAGPPFRIHGDSYYVGTCGIAAVLITSAQGHVLIDTGTEAGAEAVLANVARLGFDARDIKVLLLSHEHFDHIGGAALVQQRTGARIFASAPAAAVLASGISDKGDPQAGMHDPMEPVTVSRVLAADEVVTLGPIALTMIATPGHTPGAVSWQWQSCEGDDCKTIVYADSLSPVSADDYRFADHPDYLAAYRAGLADLATRDCDILLTPHPSASQMRKRLVQGEMADSNACTAYSDSINVRLAERLEKEAAQ